MLKRVEPVLMDSTLEESRMQDRQFLSFFRSIQLLVFVFASAVFSGPAEAGKIIHTPQNINIRIWGQTQPSTEGPGGLRAGQNLRVTGIGFPWDVCLNDPIFGCKDFLIRMQRCSMVPPGTGCFLFSAFGEEGPAKGRVHGAYRYFGGGNTGIGFEHHECKGRAGRLVTGPVISRLWCDISLEGGIFGKEGTVDHGNGLRPGLWRIWYNNVSTVTRRNKENIQVAVGLSPFGQISVGVDSEGKMPRESKISGYEDVWMFCPPESPNWDNRAPQLGGQRCTCEKMKVGEEDVCSEECQNEGEVRDPDGECVCAEGWSRNPRGGTDGRCAPDEIIATDLERLLGPNPWEWILGYVFANCTFVYDEVVGWVFRCQRFKMGWDEPNGDLELTDPRIVEHNGIEWATSRLDPFPDDPVDVHYPIDLLEIFGPCHFVDGVQVTECIDLPDPPDPTEPPQPDLVVTLVQVENPDLVEGDAIQVRFKIQNVGDLAAENAEYLVTYHTPTGPILTQAGFMGSLAPGLRRTFDVASSGAGVSYTAIPGAHQITVTADHTEALDEHDEFNNERETSVDVGSGSSSGVDLRVSYLTFDQSNPIEPFALAANLGIHNLGSVTAPASEYEVLVTPAQGPTLSQTFEIDTLAPGAELDANFTIDSTTHGDLHVTVRADAGDALSETDEENNSRTQSITVHDDDTECLPCTSGAPGNQVGDSICVDGSSSPWEGVQWQCMGVRVDGTTCVTGGQHPNGWAPVDDRCPAPETLCEEVLHPDGCGNPEICPGTKPCS